MSSPVNVTIHPSQFPENVRNDLGKSLRARKVNHKFHYDSVKQTMKWLALHQLYAPSRRDADCRAIYQRSFDAAAEKIKSPGVHVVGLGCGGGQKDTRLLQLLAASGREIFYTPCDASVAMVLTARQTALAILPERNCFPLVCDLAAADDLPDIFTACGPSRREARQRLITFFGMIPNFEPAMILPKLASLVRKNDVLLFSANLAPGKDYAGGLKRILPQYDNAPTRDWLMTFLFDLGVEKSDGELRFAIETTPNGLKRVAASFRFKRKRRIEIERENFDFNAGEKVRLFFSYRYTPEQISGILAARGLTVFGRWIANSQEEGVFLVRRSGVSAERRI